MTDTLNERMKVLAHPLRREILNWLKEPVQYFSHQEHPLDLGVSAGLIGKQAGLAQSTVSTHLAYLQRTGLVRCQKVGQWHFFKRDEDAIQQFLQVLSSRL